MQEQETTGVVTRKGQVTIPLKVRRRLGIKPGDRVVYHIEDDKIYLTAIKETLESTYGAVAPLHRPEDFQALRDQAIDDHVDQVLREMCDDDQKGSNP